jgi:serine/threonine protein kinase
MSAPRALSVVLAVLDVCACLHEAGFAHTDLHPENVLVAEDGALPRVTVLDFAQAIRLGAEGVWRGEVNWGRWEFVPPEQLQDFTTLDASVDVYASAALLAYLIRGTAPFRLDVRSALTAGGWEAVRAAFLAARASPELEGIEPRLASILRAALDVEPKHRPDALTLTHRLTEVLHAHV